ncbi:FHA domain-containing protein [Planotetraspora sp. A-T 1434]|uniref:FHA domain-containing protein n=1 Tax=Planotetraspora sp. A-T 1434 TaxID=2979219 RepID=UPI0021BE7CCF|nr:FHA domain-containing protein [Planotetraspora sp. A-T 1434]MCT9935041.1 FHA domain-containing protein [Planotetraspora sp. A-T 1434]
MTEQGVGVVRPLPGEGVVAHLNGLLVVCAAGPLVEELLGALRETAATGGDGRALARRAAQVLARAMDGPGAGEPVACAIAGPAGGGVAVLVSGAATATVSGGPDGDVHLSGRDALTWTDRLVNGPVARIELRLPGAGPSSPYSRLDGGVVAGAGVECDFTQAGDVAFLPPPLRPPAQHQAPRLPPAGPPEPIAARGPVVPPPPLPPLPPMPPAGPPRDSAPPHVSQPMPGPGPQPLPPSGPSGSQPLGSQAPGSQSSQPLPPSSGVPPLPPAPPLPSTGPSSSPSAGPSSDPFPVPPPAPPSEQVPGPISGSSAPHASPPLADPRPASGPADDGPQRRDDGRGSGGSGGTGGTPFEPFRSAGDDDPGEATQLDATPDLEPRPMVYGVDCKNDHFNDPRAPYCAVCGIPIDQRSVVPYKGPRPSLGVLLLDDGMTLPLETDYVLGRDPERAPEVQSGEARPARVTSPDGSVSRRHLRVALDNWDVTLIDLESVNGTQIQPPGDPNFYDIPPNEHVAIPPGTTVRLGVSRTMRYESHRDA